MLAGAPGARDRPLDVDVDVPGHRFPRGAVGALDGDEDSYSDEHAAGRLCGGSWGVRRFFVREPNGNVLKHPE